MSFLLRLCCGLVVASSLAHVVHAWVEQGHKPFPDGRAPIIIDPFCKIEDCHFSKEKWKELTRRAIAQWNTADVGFTFLELSENPSDDPCHNPRCGLRYRDRWNKYVPGDRPMTSDGVVSFRTSRARVYINIERVLHPYGMVGEEYVVALLVHELGHVIGLGHPDEAGQQKEAIMNSNFGHLKELQPDDIAGAPGVVRGTGSLGRSFGKSPPQFLSKWDRSDFRLGL